MPSDLPSFIRLRASDTTSAEMFKEARSSESIDNSMEERSKERDSRSESELSKDCNLVANACAMSSSLT